MRTSNSRDGGDAMGWITAGMKGGGRVRWGTIGAALAILLTAGCSSAPPASSPALGRQEAPAAPRAASGPAPLQVQAVALHDGENGVQLEVRTSGPLAWSSYRDADDDLVIELPNSVPADELAGLDLQQGIVKSAHIQQVEEASGRPLTRLVLHTAQPAEHSMTADGDRLLVDLTPIAPAAPHKRAVVASLAVADEPIESSTLAPTQVASATSPLPAAQAPSLSLPAAPRSMEVAGTPDNPVPGPPPTGVPATQLQGVEVTSSDGATVVWVLGDGEFYYSTFTLSDPERFVVDLNGVVKTAPLSTVPVGTSEVERVRIAQFKPQPDLVSRVVIDLERPLVPDIEPGVDGLKLTFHGTAGGSASTAMPAAPAAEPAPMETEEVAAAPPSSESSAGRGTPAEPLVADLATEQTEPAPMPTPAQSATPPPASRPMPPSAAPKAQAGQAADLSLYQASKATPATPPAAEPPAPAESAAPASLAGGAFGNRTVAGAPQTWQGEPMELHLKNADIKDVLRSFAQISGLNMVLQPGISSTVTVELTDVPWDQALQTVLKTSGLDYQLEGNIMRIAPVSVLRAEAEEQQRLAQAQALSIPLTTIIRRVSYATAADIARVLQSGSTSVMSARGSVVTDERTNTLIIKELPSVMPTVISVIENLDVPEPQVTIEARIIETTKRFTRTLGVQWNFEALADPEHGNTTGLVFPNNGDVTGGVNMLTGAQNGFLDISLGNVLNTFRLDAVLQAAENEGLINILSAPKITTLNNERASIQSGLQIPIQTVANNTVSVQFINATLRLDVVPHVTAAGTVLMDIDIQKREPQIAFAVPGAQNAPIATKDARTRVIVRDGGTAVIGGIYKVSSDQGEDRVPGLSNIPILKHLFKNKRRVDENEELLIFITPRVVKL
jgi:type IV pilus assembly protein PilQ